MVKCEKSGTREVCVKCKHKDPHEMDILRGCECGMCLPDIVDENGLTRKLNPKCLEIKGEIEI